MKKLLALLFILLVVVACSKPVTKTIVPSEEKTSVEEVSSEVSDVGALDEDLDLSDYDNLDKELSDIDW